MVFSRRYFAAKKAITNFQTSSSTSISLVLTEREYNRLVKKRRFRNLVFSTNPYEIKELKTYTIFKNW